MIKQAKICYSSKDWEELLIRYAKYLNFARKSQILSVLDRNEWLRRNRKVANFNRKIRVSGRHPLSRNLSTMKSPVANPSLSEGVPTAVNGDIIIANSFQKCFRMCRRLVEYDLTSFASPETRVRLLFSQP